MGNQLVWEDRFNIGVDFIDNEHMKLFKIMNKLFIFSENKNKSSWACQEGIKYFKDHALKHFAEEEAYMASISYKELETHKRLHEDFRMHILPAHEKELTIEFIGDSITCGYGVESSEGSESFSTSTENFYKSYAYIAANELNADYSVAAYSGYGVIYGCCSGEPNPNETLIKYYDIESQFESYNKKHDFTKRKMDAVVINLGTNDTCYVDKDNKASCDEFTSGYIALLKKVRSNNPDSVIICTVGLMGGNESIYPLIKNAVKKLDDDKITCFLSEHQDIDKDGAGAAWHPSEKTQKQYGHIVAEEIKKALDECK